MITNNCKTQQNTIYTLRINTEIFNSVKELARANRRSTAKEIEFILDRYLKNQN